MDRTRFQDDGRSPYEYGDEFLVVCPRCSAMARVAPPETDSTKLSPRLMAPRTVACLSCAYRQTWQGGQIAMDGPKDWYFGLPLWLQTPCCGETLWAYNQQHLEFLDRYVSATLRSRRSSGNRSAASRLPPWVKSAKNRDAVLKAIAKMRAAG